MLEEEACMAFWDPITFDVPFDFLRTNELVVAWGFVDKAATY